MHLSDKTIMHLQETVIFICSLYDRYGITLSRPQLSTAVRQLSAAET